MIPVAAFLFSVALPLPPLPLVAVVLFLCPSFAWFAATAACTPFDSCSLEMLAWVVIANILLYATLASVLWFTRVKFKSLRWVVFACVFFASAWWARLWVA
jgi:hypothetical protein